jgi:hypothetical protein
VEVGPTEEEEKTVEVEEEEVDPVVEVAPFAAGRSPWLLDQL